MNASNPETVALAKLVARAFGLTDRDYRKALVRLRARIRILENNLREKDYTFDYAKQPSKAMFKYRKAFLRNDGERYGVFMEKVQRGEAKLHTGTLLPYEIVESCLYSGGWWREHSFMRPLSEEEKLSLNATWAALEDFATGENALAVVDTSGSMYCQNSPLPAAVALSLGLYFAERAKGPYRNHFIQFSAHPELIEIKGETFTDRLRYIASFNEVANTNLEAVFDLILQAAVENRVPQSGLPAKLYIISDMEFDACVRDAKLTNHGQRPGRGAGLRLQPPHLLHGDGGRAEPLCLHAQRGQHGALRPHRRVSLAFRAANGFPAHGEAVERSETDEVSKNG